MAKSENTNILGGGLIRTRGSIGLSILNIFILKDPKILIKIILKTYCLQINWSYVV